MIDFSKFTSIAKPQKIPDVAFEKPDDLLRMQSIVSGNYGFPDSSSNGILLHGKIGTGKTTTATLIPDAMEGTQTGMDCICRKLYPVMGENTGVNLLAEIDIFAKPLLMVSNYTYVILDEVDNLSPTAMKQLKSVMDNNSKNTVFIMTTNHYSKIDETVLDRCHQFSFNKVPANAWLPSMHRVLNAYGVENIDDQTLLPVASTFNGSGRRFAKEMKKFIEGYYAMFPHLIPPHLLLVGSQPSVTTYAQTSFTVPISLSSQGAIQSTISGQQTP